MLGLLVGWVVIAWQCLVVGVGAVVGGGASAERRGGGREEEKPQPL